MIFFNAWCVKDARMVDNWGTLNNRTLGQYAGEWKLWRCFFPNFLGVMVERSQDNDAGVRRCGGAGVRRLILRIENPNVFFCIFLIRPSMWKKCGVKHCLNTVVKSVAAIKNGSQYRSSWCWERIVVSCSADYMVRGFQQRKNGSTGHVWLSIVWDIQTTYKIHRNSMFLFTFIVFLLVHWTSVIKTINDDTATRFFRCWNSLTMF